MTRSQWRRFNWLDNRIWKVGIVGLSNEEFDEYCRLGVLVMHHYEHKKWPVDKS